MFRNHRTLPAWLVALACMFSAYAEEDLTEPEERGERIDEVLVAVGTRAAPRSASDSVVPVDAISSDAIEAQGGSDMSNLLRTLVPSFHVSTNPSRDAAALLRPVNLRGLAPDHTLVLVNNKRRHRGAVIQWISNGASDGAQGPDISAIPAIAIERVEVLRDGAAAQYGSDAIAGVINFVLKDHDDGGSMEVKYGFHTEDPAEDMHTISANYGMSVGDGGFLNLSAEFNESQPTDRSVQHPDAEAIIAAGVSRVADPAKTWGEPRVRDAVKLFANFGRDLSDNLHLYGFANYTTRETETAFFYRSPQGRSGVYRSGSKMLIGGAPGCKAKYDFDATGENVPIVRDMLGADADCFAFHEMLPEGFTPTFGAEMSDRSVVVGARGILDNGFEYDLSASWGQNLLDFFLLDSMNASHGPNTQRDFDIGEYGQTETSLYANFSYPMDVGFASDLNVAGGIEWREEEFKISAGEPNSWNTGPYGADGFSARSNGFGGFNPQVAGTWERANVALHLDLEADVTERWRLQGAVRWEDFDDFGSVTTFKAATMIRVSEGFALRGSVGTGFRAPTPGQQNADNTATVVDAATGVFREQGTVAATNPVVQALGGSPLDAEESDNYTFGFVVDLDNGLSATVDWFRIDLEDRIALSATTTVTDELRHTLLAAGVSEAADFDRVRYFANDFDTETTGVDVVVTYAFEAGGGDNRLLFGYNNTQTSLESFAQDSTGARRRALEHGSPENRINVSATHSRACWDFMARYNLFGEWYDSDDGQVHDGYGMVDLSAAFTINPRMRVTFGSDNVFDSYPDKAGRSPGAGRLYPRYSPAGYSGRLVYARLGVTL